MNICFVVSSLRSGGAERVISILANGLADRGHSVTIICMSSYETFYFIDKRVNVEFLCEPYDSKSIIHGVFRNLYKSLLLAKKIKNCKCEVVISFVTQVNILAIVSNFFLKTPLIISERTHPMAVGLCLKLLSFALYRFASTLVVQTDFSKKYYQNHGISITKIFNPIRLTQSNLPAKQRQPIILGVGRVVKLKGFDLLIKAFALAKLPDWQLWIVGDGAELNNLKELAVEFSVGDRVRFWGIQKDVDWFYQNASVFVLSSHYEGFPNVLCEAMSRGMAVVAFDTATGASELVKNCKNGLLVAQDCIKSLANALKRIVSDSHLRESLSEAAPSIAEYLDENVIVGEWESLMKKILMKNEPNVS
ncbi:MAG: hypothetical protein C0412_01240 [Flavobacterium sp.]|nr:hypothetical protein [Flavobacterium sp.]